MGPTDLQAEDVWLRTATSVDAERWANSDYVKMPGSFLADLIAAALLQAARGRDMTAGALLLVAGLVKPTPLLALAAFALRRRSRALGGAALALGITVTASLLAFGVPPHVRYLQSTLTMAGFFVAGQDNQSLHGAVARALGAEEGPDAPTPAATLLIARALAVAILALVLAVSLAFPHAPLELTAAMWLTAGLVVSPVTWHHHLVWLLPAFGLATWHAAVAERPAVLLVTALALAATGLPVRMVRLLAAAPLPAPLTSLPLLGVLLLLGALAALHRGRPVALSAPTAVEVN